MRLVGLLLVAGCGRIAFDPLVGDAAGSDATVNVVGELDPSFGGDGIATPSSSARGVAYDVVTRANDYIVLGTDVPGGASTKVLMMAVGDDGALIPSWGQNGELFAAPFIPTYGYGITGLADGSVIVMGDAYPVANDDYVIGKVTAGGAPDVAFSGDGWVNYNVLGDDTALHAIVVNNVAYVCGQGNYSADMRIAIVAVRMDGTLEAAFQTGGMYSANPTAGPDECNDIVYDGTRLVAAVQVNGMVTLLATQPTGAAAPTLSPSTSGDGVAIAAHTQGAFLVVGTDVGMGCVLRFSSASTLDMSFGAQGYVRLPRDVPTDLAVDGEGRIILAGRRDGTNPWIARMLPDGSLDPIFATDGVLVVPITGQLHAVALDALGRIVAVGSTRVGTVDVPLVVRVR